LNGTELNEEYARGGLPPDKKGATTKWLKTSKMTKDEREKLIQGMRDEDGNIKVRVVGRPKKPTDEKQNQVPFRLSANLRRAFVARAKSQGFKTWQEWLRAVGAKDAGVSIEAN
jgi:hypothetical protein